MNTKERIKELARRHNAVILAHNYQRPEVQDIADFTGDSLGLSLIASESDARMIVFCGVEFMAESAAILSPEKTVVLPHAGAGCPLADRTDHREIARMKRENPELVVVTYVNSTARTKAASDYCCTSANAVEVVRSIPKDKPVLFAPDRNLGRHVSKRLRRRLVLWDGYCPVHEQLTEQEILDARRRHPKAVVMAHPECRWDVLKHADAILSTSGMLRHARESEAEEFVVATELGLLHPLKKQNPNKRFYAASPHLVCPDMKLTTLEDVLAALKRPDEFRTTVPESVSRKARRALARMLEIVPS